MQNPLLFKDPSSIRCKRFSNYSDAFKRGVFDLKQGLINTRLNCTLCGISTNVMERIKCSLCSRMFHGCCLPDKITKNTVAGVAKNPSLWWFCLECLHIANSVCVVAPLYHEGTPTVTKHHGFGSRYRREKETPKSNRNRVLSGGAATPDSVLDGNSWEFSGDDYATPDFKRNVVSSTPSKSPDQSHDLSYQEEFSSNGHDVCDDNDEVSIGSESDSQNISLQKVVRSVQFEDDDPDNQKEERREKSPISREIRRYKTRDVSTQTAAAKSKRGNNVNKTTVANHVMGRHQRYRSGSGSSFHSSNSSDTFSNTSDISIISVEKRQLNTTGIHEIKNLIAQSRRVGAKSSNTPKKSGGGGNRRKY